MENNSAPAANRKKVVAILTSVFLFIVLGVLVIELVLYLRLRFRGREATTELTPKQGEETMIFQGEVYQKIENLPEEITGKRIQGEIIEANIDEGTVKIGLIGDGGEGEVLNVLPEVVSWFPKDGEFDPLQAPSLGELIGRNDLEIVLDRTGSVSIYY